MEVAIGSSPDESADSLRELLELPASAHARGEHGDLLATPARDDVGRAQAVGEAADDLDQDLVADACARNGR